MTGDRALIDMDEAYRRLFALVNSGPTVELSLSEATFRTLAAPVRCDLDQPPFDRAMMDGYAVRAADTSNAPVALRIAGAVAAGAVPDCALNPQEAVQINTGAPIPAGANAVVRVEVTEKNSDGAAVTIRESVPAGRFITRRGSYATSGRTVLDAGTLLTPIAIGAAATAGASQVTVFRQPTVAILATGDELVDIDQKPIGSQIRNSNQYMLESLVLSAHAQPVVLDPAVDSRDVLQAGVAAGLAHDVFCITGGISMGSLDLVPEILRQHGVTTHFQKLAIKPGRPTIFATAANGTLVFALPGNPLSAFVAFELLVRPALAAREGRPGRVPKLLSASLNGLIAATTDRRSYRPARAWVGDDGQWAVQPLSWQGSGDSLNGATANALCMRPPRSGEARSGDIVRMILLDRA